MTRQGYNEARRAYPHVGKGSTPPRTPRLKVEAGPGGSDLEPPAKDQHCSGGCGGRTSFSHGGVGPRVLQILAQVILRELQKRQQLVRRRRLLLNYGVDNGGGRRLVQRIT